MPRIKGPSLGAHHELVWNDITVAVSELLEERDYETINLGHIADRAGVARNSLYRYAPDKSALMVEVARRVSTPSRQNIRDIAGSSATASVRVGLIVAELLRAFESKTVRLMLQSSLIATIPPSTLRHREGPFGDIADAMEQVIRDGVASGEFEDVADEALVSWLLSGIMRSAADSLIQSQYRSEDLIPITQRLVLNALSAPRSAPTQPV